MKKSFYSLLTLFITVIACQDSDDGPCNVSEPISELQWIKEALEDIENDTTLLKTYASIKQGKYGKKKVFLIDNCCPNCLFTPFPVYDCDGIIVGHLGDDIEYKDIVDWQTLYTPNNYECVD